MLNDPIDIPRYRGMSHHNPELCGGVDVNIIHANAILGYDSKATRCFHHPPGIAFPGGSHNRIYIAA
jgi:hypothetical protein